MLWSCLAEAKGFEVLKPHTKYKYWDPAEELCLVNQVLAGKNMNQVAIENGLVISQVKRCVQIYETEGYIGLVKHTRKKPVKEPRMNSKNRKNVNPLTMSEREELKFLREENEYLKAENAIIKKTRCLEQSKESCSTQGEKAESVKELVGQGYKLKHLLHAIRMSKSTYYFELSKINVLELRNKTLMSIIQEIFTHHKGRYGVRRVHGELLNLGFRVNHKRVQRLMRIMRLAGKRPKEKYHSYLGEAGRVADNIINRDFTTTAPLQKWTTDVSQFTFQWGKCYLSPILDMHTNEIISYDLSLHPDLKQIKRMLSKAFKRFSTFKGLGFHSDQGWQYRHDYFIGSLKEHGIIQSMSSKANCYDNGIMESFFGRLKNEMYYGYEHEFVSFAEFARALKEYIYYYNNERIQKKTGWMSPVKCRKASTQAI